MGSGVQVGKLTIRRQILCLLIGCVACFILLFVLGAYVSRLSSEEGLYQELKVLVNDAVQKSYSGDFSELKDYTYTIYDLEGIICYSNDPGKNIGERVALETLNGRDQGKGSVNEMTYVTPYLIEGRQQGMLYVSVPKDMLGGQRQNSVFYLGALALFLMMLLFIRRIIIIVKQDIVAPIKQLNKVTKSIQAGNLEERLQYDYDGEIGQLCHDFEALRSQLAFSIENEKKLKEKEKLLLAYISHDLKTPIATISGYVEGIYSGIIKGEHVHEYTGIILNKIQMLTGLIDDILEHSKSQLNEFRMEKEELYSKAFFYDILREAEADFKKNHRTFTYSDVPDVLLMIDPKRIKQVMQNLFGNAMKFTNQGDEIEANFTIRGDMLYVSIKDTGVGIEATALPFVFQEFFRGEKARTLNVAGSGLGLSISRFIIEQHGGQIECDSILGEWTEVVFTIPVL